MRRANKSPCIEIVFPQQAQAGAGMASRLDHEGWEAVIGWNPTCSWYGQHDCLWHRACPVPPTSAKPANASSFRWCWGFQAPCRWLNQKVLEYAVKAALPQSAAGAEHSKFDRKQYFYPDPAQELPNLPSSIKFRSAENG